MSTPPPGDNVDALTLPEEQQIEELNKLLVECRGLEQVEELARRFNALRVLGVQHGELRHSNVLAWLLTPDESHGFGDRFLRRWLLRVIYESDIARDKVPHLVNVAAQPFSFVRITREWRNIDVLVELELPNDQRWVIAIENKVNAKQSSKQLERYRKLVDEAFAGAAFQILVFLTVTGDSPEDSDGRWIIAFHSQIEAVLSELLEERNSTMGEGPKSLIHDYLDVLNENLMKTPRAAELAQQIYALHRRALDIIFEHKPDSTADLTEAASEMFEKNAAAAGIQMRIGNKGVVRFVPNEWATPENLSGEGWGRQKSAYILCEILLTTKPARLQIVQNKAPKAWRDDLWKAALGQKLKRIKKASGECGVWAAVYSTKDAAPSRRFDDAKQTDKVFVDALWKWTEGVLKSSDFMKAKQLVQEKLKALETSSPVGSVGATAGGAASSSS